MGRMMKMRENVIKWTRLFLLFLIVHVYMVANTGFAERVKETPPNVSDRSITIDFDNVDINLFIKFISELTGRNFIVDPAVQGSVTIISPTRISEQDAYRVFESVLEVHGYTTVPTGEVTKIVPRATARTQNVDTMGFGDSGAQPSDRVVTRLVPLNHNRPAEMQQILQPLVSQSSVLVPHTPSGMLIITETESNIKRLLEIINALDVKASRQELILVPIKHANVTNVSAILKELYGQTSQLPQANGDVQTDRKVVIVPYERTNTLVIMADKDDYATLEELIAELDQPPAQGEGNIHVYYLQNATAKELAKVLNELPREEQSTEPVDNRTAISADVSILADQETNALVITAPREDYVILEKVIEKLDIPRKMIYLEALIMEIDADKTFDVGVQWITSGGYESDTGVVFGGFSGSDGFSSLNNVTDSDTPALPLGFSLGVLKEGIEIGGVSFPSIAAILRAYKTDSDVNIISTPQILTTDNKKAEISVGENIPYVTSQNTTSSQQDYTQYEYRDIATKLSITPHISQGDSLRLEIETEVTKLKSLPDNITPTTFKRTANTTVIVGDSETVVIGGIIGQDSTRTEWKVPLLGDIPVLGWLFKTNTTTTNSTNMFIFITPRIIKNPSEMARVTEEKEIQFEQNSGATIKKDTDPGGNKKHAALLSDAGFEHLMDDRLQEAKHYFQEALTLDPSNPYALINLGVVYEKEENYPQAIAYFQQVIDSGTLEIAQRPEGYQADDLRLVEIARQNIVHLRSIGVAPP
ncbi:MAG: type II secretion system protein GspD [Desulfobulbaceae bacterium]|nr:MAG: type II secretion system protein GspD [Desulfobulbaceae bacterium]